MNNATIANDEQDTVTTTTLVTFTRSASDAFVRQKAKVFEDRFSRCRGLLHFTACRVLGGPEGAELAVRNCWLTASRNSPTFDREGAFYSWLLRVLIDEALAILQAQRRSSSQQ